MCAGKKIAQWTSWDLLLTPHLSRVTFLKQLRPQGAPAFTASTWSYINDNPLNKSLVAAAPSRPFFKPWVWHVGGRHRDVCHRHVVFWKRGASETGRRLPSPTRDIFRQTKRFQKRSWAENRVWGSKLFRHKHGELPDRTTNNSSYHWVHQFFMHGCVF